MGDGRKRREKALGKKGTYTAQAIFTDPHSIYALPFACEIKPEFKTTHHISPRHLSQTTQKRGTHKHHASPPPPVHPLVPFLCHSPSSSVPPVHRKLAEKTSPGQEDVGGL